MDARPPSFDQLCRIYQYGEFDQPRILTLKDGDVTILPPHAAPESGQKWRLFYGFNPHLVAIQNPPWRMVPSHSLSYEGQAEVSKVIIPGPLEDHHTRNWYLEPGPPIQGPFPVYYIRSHDNKKLGIDISDATIYPPQLHLVHGPGILWVIEHLKE